MLQILIDLFFPVICVWCETEWTYLCRDCKATLQAHPELCPVCHVASPVGKVCYGCRDQLSWVDSISIAFVYQSLLKKLIFDLKFHHKYQTWAYLWHKLSLLIHSDPLFDASSTLITYVPSHRWRRYVHKWYNQSQILAETVAKELWCECLALATKTRHTHSQTWLSRAKRKTNLKNVYRYSLVDSIPNHIKTVLIIDDIVTTWSTMHEVWSVIRSQYPHIHIKGVAVARSMG